MDTDSPPQDPPAFRETSASSSSSSTAPGGPSSSSSSNQPPSPPTLFKQPAPQAFTSTSSHGRNPSMHLSLFPQLGNSPPTTVVPFPHGKRDRTDSKGKGRATRDTDDDEDMESQNSSGSSTANGTAAAAAALAAAQQGLMSPPTPAPSPTPGRAGMWVGGWGAIPRNGEMQDDKGIGSLMDADKEGMGFDPQALLLSFPSLPPPTRLAILNSLLPLLTTPELLMLSGHIGPRLKRDFLRDLPQELALHCLSFVDDPRTLARAACVSKHWRKLLEDEQTWKDMCERHRFQTHSIPALPTLSLTRPAPLSPNLAIVSTRTNSAGGSDQVIIPSSTNSLPPAFGITGPEMFVASRVRRDSGLMETDEEPLNPTFPGPPPAPHLVPTGGVTQAAAQAANAANAANVAVQPGAPAVIPYNQFSTNVTINQAIAPSTSNPSIMTGQTNGQLPPLPSVVSPGAQALSASITANRSRAGSMLSSRIPPGPGPEPSRPLRSRISSAASFHKVTKRQPGFSYRMHFKKAYLTESNWLRGGRLLSSHTSSDDGVVTSLAVDSQHIIIGMANSKIHVFEAGNGTFLRTLSGHDLGVWCLTLISAGGGPLPEEDSMSVSSEDDDDHAGPSRMSSSSGGPSFNIGSYYPDASGSDSKTVKGRPVKGLRKRNRSGQIRRSSIDSAAEGLTALARAATHNATDRLPSLASVLESGTAQSGPPPNRARRMPQSDVCGAARGWGQKQSIVVSGGCDRDVRVWDLETGECLHTLHGHTSTIRCVKVIDGRPVAVSGSRDATLKVWDVEKGVLLHSLVGHQHSVRCIEIAGNQLVSGSYDCTCRIWDLDTGECLQTLRGHYHQIYAVAFDGERVATGSLDSTVRIWSAATGECVALLQGHTSLVGQLQLTGDTLITGGSDGRVIIFDLVNYTCLQRICAHDNSVTCLQFDDRFIVSGGNDGRVKLWDIRTGNFIRELSKPCEAVWRVTFRDDKCAILCKRHGKTILEVLSFVPEEV